VRTRAFKRKGYNVSVSAPFLIDAVADSEQGWAGRVRVDGRVLFLCASNNSQDDALEEARGALGSHLQMLFSGATDVDQEQQTERYGSLVEVEAARVLREAAGWRLTTVQAQDGHFVAFFHRNWH
jgi:hypothetical protein